MNMVRSISFRRKANKAVVGTSDQEVVPQVGLKPSSKIAARIKQGKPLFHKSRKASSVSAAEVLFADFLKNISTEIVKSVTNKTNDPWNLEEGDHLGLLAPMAIDPVDILSSIDIKDVTESVAEILMILIKKLADELLLPFLRVLRMVLESLLGDKSPLVIIWIENFVRSVVEVIFKALFVGQESSKVEKWTASLTEDLLKALLGIAKELDLDNTLADPSLNSNAAVLSAKEVSYILLIPLITSKAKYEDSVEGSVDDSLKATIEDFKAHIEKALR